MACPKITRIIIIIFIIKIGENMMWNGTRLQIVGLPWWSGPVAKTPRSQGAQVSSLVRELDPTLCVPKPQTSAAKAGENRGWASPVQGVRKEVTEREVSRAQGVGQEVEKLIVGRQQPQPTGELPIPPKEPQSLYYGSHLLWGTAPYFCGPGGH